MDAHLWIIFTWIVKVFLYLGLSMSVGGLFCYHYFCDEKHSQIAVFQYIRWGAVLGLISSVLSFLLLIASFAQTGFSGLWNATYFSLLMNTPVGMMHTLRILSFLALVVVIMLPWQHRSAWSFIKKLLITTLCIPIIISFSQLGHVTNLAVYAQVLVSFHVAAMSLWMGSLYPLWWLNRHTHRFTFKTHVEQFGQTALGVVGILIVCGVSVLFLLLPSIMTLFTTPYGNTLLVKLLLVFSILLLAACNKLYFTPRLDQPNMYKVFRSVLTFEMLLGFAILVTTSFMTTVVGID